MKTAEELRSQALAVLDANRRAGYTAPAADLYPHQWLWDSCFTAIGLRHVDIARAQQEITSLFSAQWHNGMLPNMVFAPDLSYEADRRAWQSEINPNSADNIATSGITQPPLLAEAIVQVGARLKPAERHNWYRQVFPGLLAYHQWLYRDRDPQNSGLVTCVHPWETGMDTSPPWMHLLRAMPRPLLLQSIETLRLYKLVGLLRRDLKTIPVIQRYETADALLMLHVQRRLRKLRYSDEAMLKRGPFSVADLTFNCILIRNNRLLMQIARAIEQPVPPGLRASFTQARQALEGLFDEATGQYYSRDCHTNHLMRQASVASLLPLYAGCISKERAARLVSLIEDDHCFGPAYPVPSVPLNSVDFNAQRYWQGPTWVNINWLLINGLRRYGYSDHADAITEATLEMVAKHGFFEYYNPRTGKPLGAANFSWTAALTLDLLN